MNASSTVRPDVCREKEEGYIDSTQMGKTLSTGMLELHAAGRLTTIETLREQLTRKNCAVRIYVASESKISPVELYRKNREAVLVIGSFGTCGKCGKFHANTFATGFLVTSNGVMITNYHVVDNGAGEVLGAMTYHGEVYPVKEVLAADKGGDIAVLQLEGSGFPYLTLFPEDRIGSKVWVISNPAQQFFTFTEGIISARTVVTADGMQTRRIAVTAEYGGGSSGAPLFDEYGSVIGMVTGLKVVSHKPVSESHNFHPGYPEMVINYCVPAELILERFSAGPIKAPETEE
jgi:S1-C subfamily serine protease